MNSPVEISIETVDGIADCMLDLQEDESGTTFYSVTVLYPNIVNGFSRSEVYCHNMLCDSATGKYVFDRNDEIHPRVKKLEQQLSAAIGNIS